MLKHLVQYIHIQHLRIHQYHHTAHVVPRFEKFRLQFPLQSILSSQLKTKDKTYHNFHHEAFGIHPPQLLPSQILALVLLAHTLTSFSTVQPEKWIIKVGRKITDWSKLVSRARPEYSGMTSGCFALRWCTARLIVNGDGKVYVVPQMRHSTKLGLITSMQPSLIRSRRV